MPCPGSEPQQSPVALKSGVLKSGTLCAGAAPLVLANPVLPDPALTNPDLAGLPGLAPAGAPSAPALLSASEGMPERALRVIVCGEVSAGKSTAINALLRRNVLLNYLGQARRPPVLVTGGAPGLYLRYMDQRTQAVASLAPGRDFAEVAQCIVQTDAPALAGFEIIEMPAPPGGDLSEAALEFIASADILIWVTIASQAWRLTERTVLERLGARRPAEAVLVVSRADKLRSAADAGRIRARLAEEAGAYFGEIVFLSGARGLIARSGTEDAAFAQTAGAGLMAVLGAAAGRIRAGAPRSGTCPGSLPPVGAFAPGGEAQSGWPDGAARPAPAGAVKAVPAGVVELAAWRTAAPGRSAAMAGAALPGGADAAPAAGPDAAAAAGAETALAAGPGAALAAGHDTAFAAEALRALSDRIEGLVAAGITRLSGAADPVVLAGAPDVAAGLAEFCRSSLGGHEAAFAAGQQVEAAIIAMRGQALVYQVLPASGLIVFALCAGTSSSTGALRSAMVRLSTAVARHYETARGGAA